MLYQLYKFIIPIMALAAAFMFYKDFDLNIVFAVLCLFLAFNKICEMIFDDDKDDL